MALEADLSLKNTPSSIKSPATQQAQLRFPVYEFTRPLYKNKPTHNKKNQRLIYCN